MTNLTLNARLKYAYRGKDGKRIAVYALSGSEEAVNAYVKNQQDAGQEDRHIWHPQDGDLIRYQSGDVYPNNITVAPNKGRYYFDNSAHEDMMRLLAGTPAALVQYLREYNKSITMFGDAKSTNIEAPEVIEEQNDKTEE